MTLNEYQEQAAVTKFISPKLFLMTETGYIPVPYAYDGLGLGEAGELQNKIKKVMRDAGGVVTEQTRTAIKGELGGLLWYLAMTAKDFDIPLEDVAQYNIAQLRDREARGVLHGNGDNR